MTLQDLLNNLSPINTKEKVDTLIQEMKKCGLKLTKNAELVIRCSIKKANIQRYILDTYSRLFVDKEKTQNTAKNNSKNDVVTKADITRIKRKLKKNKKVSKKVEERPQEDYGIPSIMRAFGSNRKKKMSYKEREKIAPHKKEYSTTTKTSLFAIGIPMK